MLGPTSTNVRALQVIQTKLKRFTSSLNKKESPEIPTYTHENIKDFKIKGMLRLIFCIDINT